MRVWVQAARPQTLIAGLSPVAVGTILAIAQGRFRPWVLLCTLVTALGIQIGTNFANDYYDFVKGADTHARKGPQRVTQAGLVEPSTIRRAVALVFLATALTGSCLVWLGGPLFAALLALSIALGVLYTGGPYPLAYLGLGDLFVLLFFGPIAVWGTYTLQTGVYSWTPVIAGCGVGLVSTAILAVNNLRDQEEDRQARKRTLPVRFGDRFGRIQYAACLTAAFLLPLLLLAHYPYAWLASLTALPAFPVARAILTTAPAGYALLFPKTPQLLLIYTLLLCIGLSL
jgi:1,4-dihydroxy-2-naphthoate octaprenyltransferase